MISEREMSHYEMLEELYISAPVNQALDLEIKVTEGEALIKQKIALEHCHSMGAMHGSYAFKCLDDACYFAANSLESEYFMLTTDDHIRLIRPVTPKSGYVQAIGKVVSRSKRLMICEGVLAESQGRKVARVTVSFMASGMRFQDYMSGLHPSESSKHT